MRFVDLRSAEIAGVRFAFWDTVEDRFVTGINGQAWGTWQEFLDDLPTTTHDNTIQRWWRLSPAWIDKAMSEDEEQGVRL